MTGPKEEEHSGDIMNKQSTSASASGSIGFFGLFTIVFIVLKLLGVTNE